VQLADTPTPQSPTLRLHSVAVATTILTVAVSVVVCEIFSVKEWRDLENQVRGRSRLLKIASFDRPYRDLEIGVRGHSRSLKLVPFETWVRFPIRLL